MNEWREECLAILSAMNSSNQQTFGEAHAAMYALVLSELGEESSRAAVTRATKTLKWRPSPAELREMAADLSSPVPAVGILWEECWHKAVTDGYARPNWTHPMIGDIVAQMGGWQTMRETSWPDSHPAHIDAQRSRFEAIYGQVLGQWREAVCEQLRFPHSEREPKYFPHYTPFVAPKQLPPGDDFTPLPSLSELEQYAPDDIKERLSGLRKRIGS